MSDALFPIPTDTPVSDDPKFGALKFGMIWNRFFKAIGDDLLAANIVRNLPVTSITSPVVPDVTAATLKAAATAFKFTLNATRCEVTYYNTTPLAAPLVVNLPYTAALAFDIAGTIYAPETTSVTIPAATSYLRFWFVAKSVRN